MGPLVNLNDQELVALLKDGDHDAYTEIYNRYSGVLYLHAYNKLRNREEARDILQELFTTIWNNRGMLDVRSNLSGYLYTAVKNRIFKHFARKENADSYLSSFQEAASSDYITDHRVRQNQLKALIEREVDALPPKMKEVFILSRQHHLSHKEIAEQLNIAEPTVKKQVNNALKILRERLGLYKFMLFLFLF